VTATVYTLDEAKQRVLQAVQTLVHDEQRLAEADGADLAAAVRGYSHLFDLDEWVLGQPMLKRLFCRFPLCFNSPRPPKTDDDGKSRGGHPPAYCEHGVDEEGMPHDNPQRAKRRRDQLRAQRDQELRGILGEQPPVDERLADDSRPVTHSHEILLGKIPGLQASLDRTSDLVRTLIDIARRGADDASRLAEIEAIENAANQRVETEKSRRINAERVEREALDAVARMTDDLAEANAAAAGEAEDAREALDELAKTRLEAKQTKAEAAERVEAAETALQNAIAEADRRVQTALTELSAAHQAVTDAQAERAEAKQETRRLSDIVDKLRAAAVAREREVESTLDTLRTEHDKQRAALQLVIDQLRQRLDAAHDKHETEMRELRSNLEGQAERRVAAAESVAARVHAAELAAATETADALRSRVETAEAEVARLRGAST
jgi:DNA repair exonuclease SbcCD ATPase subunit